jgi:hypothetical protein
MRDLMRCVWFPMVVLLAMLALGLAGCKTSSADKQGGGAALPSDVKSAAYVANEASRAVTMNASELDRKLLATALESIQESGAVAYVERVVALRGPDKVPIKGTDGNPVLLRQTCVVKVNSMKDLSSLAGANKLTLVLAGGQKINWDVPLSSSDELAAAMLEGLRLEVDQLGAVGVATKLPEIITARAAERAAILNGLTANVKERYVGAGKVIEVTADGLVKVITATGDSIVGRLVAVTPLGAAAETARVVLADPVTEKVQTVEVKPAQ